MPQTQVLIPTCSPNIRPLTEAIIAATPHVRVLVSLGKHSAAQNRNACLDMMRGDVAIMIDDDVSGFYPGWDFDLMKPFADQRVCMVSARLLTPEGTLAFTCADSYELEPPTVDVEITTSRALPTAAIAFRKVPGIRFDEAYVGSGFEDNDFCLQYQAHDPNFRFLQSNECRLIHANEQKNQGGAAWKQNQAYFAFKWMGKELGLTR